MTRLMLKSKIHRATVTDANLNYEGSISIDPLLIDAADLIQYEHVDIYNVTNGERFGTYAIKGIRGSGEICINGAAAWKAQPGHVIIICSYSEYHEAELGVYKPTIVYVDKDNRILRRSNHLQLLT